MTRAWQYLPSDVERQDQRRQQADDWAAQQRATLAEAWAARQAALSARRLATLRTEPLASPADVGAVNARAVPRLGMDAGTTEPGMGAGDAGAEMFATPKPAPLLSSPMGAPTGLEPVVSTPGASSPLAPLTAGGRGPLQPGGPESTPGAVMGGTQRVPGATRLGAESGGPMDALGKGAERAATALGGVLDLLARPNYAGAGLASEGMRVVPGEAPLETLARMGRGTLRGLLGQERKTYTDVLGESGVAPGLGRDLVGFGLDVALDPTTYLSLGSTAAGKTGLKLGVPLTRIETTLLRTDPLTAVVAAAARVGERVPGAATAARALRGALGEAVVPDYALKAAGYGGFAEDLQRTRRMTSLAKRDAVRMVRERFDPLTDAQRDEFFALADQGLERVLGAGATAADIEDDAVRTVYNWYRGEYQPVMREIKEQMGLTSFLDDYIRHVFPQKLKPTAPGTGPAVLRDPGSFKRRTGKAGFTTDPRVAIGFDHAETMVRKATNDLINSTLEQYGAKLRPRGAVPEGMVEFWPRGRHQFYKGEFDPASEILRQTASNPKALEAELTQVGRIIDLAEAYGVPVVKNNRLRTALGRFVSTPESARLELKGFTGGTASHEFGHLYDWVLGGPGSGPIEEALQRTWGAFGRPRPGGRFFEDVYNSPLAQRLPLKHGGRLYRADPRELFAEWFSVYLRDPAEAMRQTPLFTDHVQTAILKPEHVERINGLRDFMAAVERMPNPMPALRALTDQPQTFERALRLLLPKKSYVGVRAAERWALPEPVARALNDLTSPRETIGLLKAYDTVQGIWKASVTSWFPEFHTRNMLGNFYNNWLGGVYDPRAYLTAARVQQAARTGGLEALGSVAGVPAPKLYRAMEESGVLHSGFYGGEVLDELTRTGAETSALVRGLSAGRTVGEALENNAKIAHVVGQLERGMPLEQALASAKKHLFDYTELTPFERNVMRRVVPFYTWTRKNVPLQLESLARDPRKPLLVEKTRRAVSREDAYETEMQLAPDYVAEQLNVVLGKDDQGNLHVLSGLGLPLEDLNRFYKITPARTLNSLAALASPLLRVPVEAITDHSFFTGKPITDEATNNYYRKATSVLAAVPGLRDWLEIGERRYTDPETGESRVTYTANPLKNYVFLALLGRAAQTAGKFAGEQRSLVGAVAETTLPGKDYTVNLGRQLVPFTDSMAAAQTERGAQLDQLARAFYGGQLSGPEAREIRGRIRAEIARTMMMLMEQATAREEKYIPNLAGKERLRRGLLPEGERLLAEYYELRPGPTETTEALVRRLDAFVDGLTPEQRVAFDEARGRGLAKLEQQSPLAARMEREYQQSLDSYRTYRAMAEWSGLTADQLKAASRFRQALRDTSRSVPGANPARLRALVARRDPEGALAHALKQRVDATPAGKALRRTMQLYWAAHPELGRWFSESALVE